MASLQSRLSDLITAIGADIKSIRTIEVQTEAAAFSRSGALTVSTGTFRYPIKGGTYTIDSVAAMVGTAPTGASLIVDVKKNGTTIYGTAGNRPTVAAGANAATVGAHSVTTTTTGDYLTVDITQIGSTVAGSDLTVVIRLRRTS